MQPPPPRGPGAGALLLAFLAGGLGGAAGALLVQPRASSSPASEDTALQDSIAALDRTVRALGEQIAGSGRMPVPAGTQPIEKLTPAQASGPGAIDGAQLEVRLDHIAKLLEVRATGGGSEFAGAAPVPPLDRSGSTAAPGCVSARKAECAGPAGVATGRACSSAVNSWTCRSSASSPTISAGCGPSLRASDAISAPASPPTIPATSAATFAPPVGGCGSPGLMLSSRC